MHIDDILYHLGEGTAFQDIPATPPIHQTSNFTFSSVETMRQSLREEDSHPFYTRGANPTVQILQQKMAALENTEKSLIFSSGSSAITAAIISQVGAGDHLICVSNPYGWTRKLIENILAKFDVSCDFIPGGEASLFQSKIKSNTRLIYLESPNSWTYEMQDLEAIAQLARAHDITTIIDNSCASPLYQRPADHGIDIIVHSASKYLTGHADMVAGVLCTSSPIYEQIFKNEFMTFGGIISPFEAWLMIRSLRTLPMRLEKITQNAMIVARFLENHSKIRHFFFTHAANYPQAQLRDKYLKDAGGLMTIDLNTEDQDKVEQFCNALKRFKLGCSWGGFESLAFPAMTTIGSMNYDKPNTITNRIRLYVGMEDPQLLIEDLTNAFEKI